MKHRNKRGEKRREFLRFSMVLAAGTSLMSLAIAKIDDINDAINKSGRQRMLSQRMAKAYLQLGQGIDTYHSRKILASSITTFEAQLAELSAYAPTAENRQVFAQMEKNWMDYKNLLSGATPNPTAAKNLMLMSDEMLVLAQSATVQLEKFSGSPSAKLVNLAGRQRMLSQRMAKYYQALQWGVAPPDAIAKLEAARKDFIAAMEVLQSAPANTPQIKDGLALAQQQWLFFDNALHQFGEKSANPQDKLLLLNTVASSSERILEVMDSVTTLYQKNA
ncbi:MAG: type IV pili methyl-accepting chemotaxis transducer N-terminal domain-containing protein [Burkholderiales bacterium]|nr:type IV pili methyl-accepting chemotaxis transducer N-terminal domain-containing protein [Burkholderiales bacterium]